MKCWDAQIGAISKSLQKIQTHFMLRRRHSRKKCLCEDAAFVQQLDTQSKVTNVIRTILALGQRAHSFDMKAQIFPNRIVLSASNQRTQSSLYSHQWSQEAIDETDVPSEDQVARRGH